MQCEIALDGGCSLVSYTACVALAWQKAEFVCYPSSSQTLTHVQREPVCTLLWPSAEVAEFSGVWKPKGSLCV